MEKRIYFHDTDCGGVVYYGNYLKYLEEGRTELWEDSGLKIQGFPHAVRYCNVTYKSPAKYGNVLLIETSIKKLTAAQIVFDQVITNKEDGRLIAQAEVALVCLTEDFKPCAIPAEVKEKLLK